MPKDMKLVRAGVTDYNTPKRTPRHPRKSHIVVAKVGSVTKTIRFGQQGVRGAGPVRPGESQLVKRRRAAFRARHARNIKRGKLSAAWWSNKVKWGG